MSKGSLYWEEGSRGIKAGKQDIRGRWCAEKSVNGRRVRLRSGDINRCLAFLNDTEIKSKDNLPDSAVEIKGFPGYFIDLSTNEVWSTRCSRARKLKIFKSHNIPSVTLQKKGIGSRVMSFPRLLYAVCNGIDYNLIPTSLVVTIENGEPCLHHRKDITNNNFEKSNRMAVNLRVKMLERKIHESQIMLEYYKTFDITPVVEYIFSIQEDLISKAKIRYGMLQDRAENLVSAATEKLIRHIMEEETHLSDIFYAIWGYVKTLRSQKSRSVLYVERR